MSDKSYVTLTVCPICHKENGSILMDTRLRKNRTTGRMETRDTFDMHTIDPYHPCDACKAKYLKDGVLLINPQTCSLVVIRVSAFERMFNVPLPASHIAFTEQAVIEALTQN